MLTSVFDEGAELEVLKVTLKLANSCAKSDTMCFITLVFEVALAVSF